MKNITLRKKLTLWYFFSLGTIFFLLSLAVGLLIHTTIQAQIDHHVHIAVSEAKQIVENYSGVEREALVKNLVSAHGMRVIVLSPDGAPILETNSPDIALMTEHQLQKIMLTQTLYDSAPTHFTANEIRFAAIPAQVRAGKGVVAVGYSTKILYATYYRLLAIISAILVFLVIPTAIIGYKLFQNNLNPLEQIANQAKSISAKSLSQRISTHSSSQELIDIEQALNGMLDKLENIFVHEHRFFSDAAHTLKTPLARLRSQLENTALPSSSKRDFLQVIDQANATIQDLLYLSRIGQVKPSLLSVNLSQVMLNLSELANTLGEAKKLKITTHIEPNIKISADHNLLVRALSNIVQNSVYYNKPNGQISILLHQNHGHIYIEINDTGQGINQLDLPHVFKRFFRAKNTGLSGSGLGLAITKAVIDSLGGKIILTSKAGQGTKVKVIL